MRPEGQWQWYTHNQTQHTISPVLDMTIKEEIYVMNRICPLLHVSAYNLAGCIARHTTLIPTRREVFTRLFNMLVLTGPIRMHETYYLTLNHICSMFHLFNVLLVLLYSTAQSGGCHVWEQQSEEWQDTSRDQMECTCVKAQCVWTLHNQICWQFASSSQQNG